MQLWKKKVALPQREKLTWRVPGTMLFPAGVVRRGLRQQVYPPVQDFPLVLDSGSEHWREDWMSRRPGFCRFGMLNSLYLFCGHGRCIWRRFLWNLCDHWPNLRRKAFYSIGRRGPRFRYFVNSVRLFLRNGDHRGGEVGSCFCLLFRFDLG